MARQILAAYGKRGGPYAFIRQIATFRTAARLTHAKYGTSSLPTHVHRSQNAISDANIAAQPTRLSWRNSDTRDPVCNGISCRNP
jgi:hypothetical protein